MKELQPFQSDHSKLKEEFCTALRNPPGECYRRILICLSGEVETPSSPIRLLNSGCKTSGWNDDSSRFPDVIHPGVKWR